MTADPPRRGPALPRADAGKSAWVRKLADLEAVIVAEPGEDVRVLLRELHAVKLRTRHIWPAPAILPQATDILVCGYLDDLPQRFGWLPGSPPVALVLLVPEGAVDIDLVIDATPDSLLSPPYTPNAVRTAMAHAISQFRYGQRLRGKIERLEENIQSIRVVERAKSILMEKRKIGEAEAYGVIRQLAMSKRVPATTIAMTIVDSSELLDLNFT